MKTILSKLTFALVALGGVLTSPAATYTVTNTNDAGPGTFRQAIIEANGNSGEDVIDFNLPGAGAQTIVLESALPEIGDRVVITGPGADLLCLQRSTAAETAEFRILRFDTSYAQLSGLTISNGVAYSGAGVCNWGTLVLSHCTIRGNQGTAFGSGAGVFNWGDLTILDCVISDNSGNGEGFRGAGIANSETEGYSGVLVISNSVIRGNFSQGSGGGIQAGGTSVTIIGGMISGNTATATGGGISADYGNDLSVAGTLVRGNTAYQNGGGVYLDGYSASLINCEFSHNTADRAGGGIYVSSGDLTLRGGVLQTNSATSGSGGGIYVRGQTLSSGESAAVSLLIEQTTIAGNQARFYGGGLSTLNLGDYDLRITNSTFSGNHAGQAGGAVSSGVTIPPSPVTRDMLGRASTYTSINLNGTGTNLAVVSPGAGVTFNADYTAEYTDGAGCPGCITQHYLGIDDVFYDCHDASFGTQNGTVSAAFSAPTEPGVYYISQTATWWYYCDQFGIPPFHNGPDTAVAVLIVGNPAALNCHLEVSGSTFSGNSADARAGALLLDNYASLRAESCTVADNSAPEGGGAFMAPLDARLLPRNTIAAGNTAATGPDLLGAVASLGHNLVGIADGASGLTNGSNSDLVGTLAMPLNARLGPLADNGGLTLTHVLLSGSPAINAGDSSGVAATDQRGRPRIAFGTNDIGAYELQGVPPVLHCPTNILAGNDPGECSALVSFTVTATATPSVNVICTPASGSIFPVGMNLVRCAATNVAGTDSCSFTVTVRDVEPPSIVCPTNVVAPEMPRGAGTAVVTFPVPVASDVCDSNVSVQCSPLSGSSFVVGYTVVRCQASDSSGNTNSCSFLVQLAPYRLTVTNTADAGPGSLRQALLAANAAPDENLIVFAFPGPGPHVIHLLSALPAVNSPMIIDALPQSVIVAASWPPPPPAPTWPLVELNGGGIVADGLVLNAGGATVRGLAIHGFATGLRVQGAGRNVIQANFIGTDAAGNIGPGNSASGILITSPANTIGGTGTNTANVIGGNAGSGLRLDTAAAVSNVVIGNFIGASLAGSARSNGLDGVTLSGAAARNTIGRTTAGSGNLILHHGRSGVALEASAGTGNGIRGNFISANRALGIDLGANGPTANDAFDFDTGPNSLQNFPLLTNVTSIDGVTTIQGTLNSATGLAYRLDFFVNNSTDISGYGEGGIYLGSGSVTTSGGGTAQFLAAFPLAVTSRQFITATATDPANNTSEFSPPVGIATPPEVVVDPIGATNVALGQPAGFCAEGAGSPPIFYQWRHNGVNIPGATNACYEIPITEVPDGGTYDVVIINSLGASLSGQAPLTLNLPSLAAADDFANAAPITGTTGLISWRNIGATRQPGEPLHAGKPGGKSVWYKWTPTKTGITTVGTRGSTFDTLLAVYEGNSVSNLQSVAYDEDRGGFFSSGIRFNAYKNRTYYIAVDGFGGESGTFAFGWSHENTKKLLPTLDEQPQSQTVAPGGTARFTVLADCMCGEGHRHKDCPDWEPHECDEDDDGKLEHDHHHHDDHKTPKVDYQWFRNGVALPGATGPTLVIANVQPANLGTYTVQVSTQHRTIESQDASLQINLTGLEVQPVLAMDKQLDAANAPVQLRLGNAPPVGGLLAPAALVRGYTGTQIFDTIGATTSGGEHPVCGVLGGASEWISFVAAQDGTLVLNTDGSSYDTVMAVFKRFPGSSAWVEVICDNTNGLDRLDSALSVPVEAGKTNLIVVDGVKSAKGTLKLNYSLVTPAQLASLGFTTQKEHRLRYTGRPTSKFSIQVSGNFATWTTLITTNAPNGTFDYTDKASTTAGLRFYRAVLLP